MKLFETIILKKQTMSTKKMNKENLTLFKEIMNTHSAYFRRLRLNGMRICLAKNNAAIGQS